MTMSRAPMTAGQIDRASEMLRAALSANAAALFSGVAEKVLDEANVATEWMEMFWRRVMAMDPVVDLDADPYCPKGWTVVKHERGGQFEWDPKQIELFVSEEQHKKNSGGHPISLGLNVQEEVNARKPFNANLLDWLLANPQFIPRSFIGMLCWGTVYRDEYGDEVVRFLYPSGGAFNQDPRTRCIKLRDYLSAGDPAAVRKPAAE